MYIKIILNARTQFSMNEHVCSEWFDQQFKIGNVLK
jgi:hypothetical protein